MCPVTARRFPKLPLARPPSVATFLVEEHIMSSIVRSFTFHAGLGVALATLGACATTAPVDTASCSSGSMYSGGGGEEDAIDTAVVLDEGDGSSTMNPGQDCIVCHASGEGPTFTIAGTVMGAYADIDDCNGVADVTVTITDADGVVTTLTTNSAGNFYSTATLAMPYTAELSLGGQTRAMSTPQSDGDCASCHTAAGANDAPGRVISP